MAGSITENEILEELRKAMSLPGTEEGDAGMTMDELAEALGRGEKAVRVHVRELIRSGKAATGRRTITSIDNRRVKVPVYRLL